MQVAQITLQIPDNKVDSVIAAICASRMSLDAMEIPPNPANAKAVIIRWIKEAVIQYETRMRQEALEPIDTSGIVS